MKFIVTGLAILGVCTTVFGEMDFDLDTPNDDYGARQDTEARKELKPLLAEYRELLKTRILPLEYCDITNIFGPKLEEYGDIDFMIQAPEHRPLNYALPLFVPDSRTISTFFPGIQSGVPKSKGHLDYHAVGNVGFLQVYYQRNGENIYFADFYLRTDDKFVPLLSKTDFARRLKWDKARFASLKLWLDQHLPKLTDLGVVKVSTNALTRVALGNGKFCLIGTVTVNGDRLRLDRGKSEFDICERLDSTNSANKFLAGTIQLEKVSTVWRA
jgi:hypothetical protein